MTQPSLVRDADGSLWALQADGTYNLRSGGSYLRGIYQGYSLKRIEEDFGGIISKTYDTPRGEQDYTHLRR